jgi:DNA gyrase/topoisomerase IV subunit B
VKKGKRWLVTIATPGQGSQGYYPEQVLKETGPLAFPKGTKAFFNHDTNRDVRDMVGTYDQAFWNEEEGVLQAYLTPFPRYASVLDEAVDQETGISYIEASVHVASRKDVRTGHVKELVPNRANTVDLVAFAGLEGSGLKYQVESLFAAAAADSEQEKKKENNVEITKEMWDAQTAALAAVSAKFDTFVAESKTELQGKADADAVEQAVATRLEEALAAYAEVEKSINDADILDTQKESLKAKAIKGEDITSELAQAVSFVAEARAAFTPNPKSVTRGTVVVVDESLDSAPKTFTPGRWSN